MVQFFVPKSRALTRDLVLSMVPDAKLSVRGMARLTAMLAVALDPDDTSPESLVVEEFSRS